MFLYIAGYYIASEGGGWIGRQTDLLFKSKSIFFKLGFASELPGTTLRVSNSLDLGA